MVVFTNVKKEDIEQLCKHGFSKEEPKTIYEDLRLRSGRVTLVHYTSQKLQVQGSGIEYEEVVERIRKSGIGEEKKRISFVTQSGVMIGSDETLKGDTFGGIVVAGVKADDALRARLVELGVADSKSLKDEEIMNLAHKIKKMVSCEIISLLPEEYNEAGSLTGLLNDLHAKVGTYLKPGKHVVDEYPGCRVGDIITTKAESKYVEVAAASILARAAGLEQLRYLSSRAGFTIPKGSTHVKAALLRLKKEGLNPKGFVKMHFKNVGQIF